MKVLYIYEFVTRDIDGTFVTTQRGSLSLSPSNTVPIIKINHQSYLFKNCSINAAI